MLSRFHMSDFCNVAPYANRQPEDCADILSEFWKHSRRQKSKRLPQIPLATCDELPTTSSDHPVHTSDVQIQTQIFSPILHLSRIPLPASTRTFSVSTICCMRAARPSLRPTSACTPSRMFTLKQDCSASPQQVGMTICGYRCLRDPKNRRLAANLDTLWHKETKLRIPSCIFTDQLLLWCAFTFAFFRCLRVSEFCAARTHHLQPFSTLLNPRVKQGASTVTRELFVKKTD